MKLPKYAQEIPKDELVQIICRGQCGKGRFARKSDGAIKGLSMEDPNHYAQCIVCGYRAHDPYNWVALS